jgi:site-specific DNA recombinase
MTAVLPSPDSPPVQVAKAPGILRVVIYARISKIGKSNSTNTAIQVAECMREIKYLAKDRGVKVIIVAIFQEDDKSASKYSKKPRPMWNRTVELVHGNWVDMVMATEMERLTRRPNEMSVLIDHADAGGELKEINLTSDDVFDLTTDNGIYRARQAVALAERESNKLSKRARRKQTELAEQGRAHSGHRTYGFTVGNGTLEDTEVKVLQEMAEKRLKAWSYKDIAYWLNENGHKTSQGKDWYPITVRNTLRRKCYAPWPADPKFAIRVHKGAEYQATWPAVFEPDVWEQLQIIAKVGADKYKDRPKPRKYPLTGLLVCGNCGMPLNGETKRDKPDRPLRRVYHCRVQGDTQRKRGCGGVTRGADPLEDFILDCLFYRLDTPDLAKLLEDDTNNSERIKELLDARTHQERRIQDVLDDYAEGELTREQKNRGKAKAEAKLDEINQEIDRLNRGHRASMLIPMGTRLQDAWKENDSVQWRREVLGLVIEKIIVQPGGGKPRYECKHTEGVYKFDPNQVEIAWRV